jgi:hypothetical protein
VIFTVYRCSSGYLLTHEGESDPEVIARLGPLDLVGRFQGDRLSPDVQARVIADIIAQGYAVIAKNELVGSADV